MNFNISPIAFWSAKDAQDWRVWYAQKKCPILCGNDLSPFYIIDEGEAPTTGELYEPNTSTKVADIKLSPYFLDHTISAEGKSAHIWIFQGGVSGVFGRTTAGYYYLKIGNWYSDIFKIGELPKNYVQIDWQFFDDIITADGTPISKNIKYRQIFETNLWHPEYEIEEEGKTNNGIFYAMQQTTKKTSGFSALVNESQLDCLNLIRMGDVVTIRESKNGVVKTLQTNTFEIRSKWESDDIASIECQFDLFSIIRKYQQSNVEPEPIPIPTPPTPPSNYVITGTSTANSIILKVNGTNVNVPVINGAFSYNYDNKLTSIGIGANIKTIDFSQSCKLTDITSFDAHIFGAESQLESINLNGCTFESCTDMSLAFQDCVLLTEISMPNAVFTATTDFNSTFERCKKLERISMPLAIVDGIVEGMFEQCEHLTSLDLSSATLSNTLDANHMFSLCHRLSPDGITMPNATFEKCTSFFYTFSQMSNYLSNQDFVLTDIFPSFISAEITNIDGILASTDFDSIDISAMDLSQCVTANSAFILNYHTNSIVFDKTNTDNVGDWRSSFYGLRPSTWSYLTDVDFSGATNIEYAFVAHGGQSITPDAMTINAVFDNVTSAEGAFRGNGIANWLGELNLPNATLESATNVKELFAYNVELETIYAPNLNLLASVNANGMFANLPKLKNVTIGIAGTMKQNVSLAQSPLLTEASITNIVAWLADLSGQTAKTITFNSIAWNNLSSAAQSSLSTAIANKNWTLQN